MTGATSLSRNFQPVTENSGQPLTLLADDQFGRQRNTVSEVCLVKQSGAARGREPAKRVGCAYGAKSGRQSASRPQMQSFRFLRQGRQMPPQIKTDFLVAGFPRLMFPPLRWPDGDTGAFLRDSKPMPNAHTMPETGHVCSMSLPQSDATETVGIRRLTFSPQSDARGF